MADFDTFLDQCWSDHASQAEAVAERVILRSMSAGIDEIPRLAHLGAHVLGEHLGQWQTGIDWLSQLDRRSEFEPGSEPAAALQRSIAMLRLASGQDVALEDETPSERVQIRAMVAAALAGRGELERAVGYFEQALAETDELQREDPAQRAIAVTANNLAADLEQKSSRTPAETELMLSAARAARKHWEIAGTWVHTERAEYRLAKSHLAAGQVDEARGHAEACLALCQANSAPALELFWSHEALASVAKASDDPQTVQEHVQQMQLRLGVVDDSVRKWCEGGLARLL